MDALDPLEFERYRRTIRENRTRGDEALLDLSDLELAKALGAVGEGRDSEIVRVLGLLLFGREEVLTSTLPGHEVAFQMLFGTQVEVNDFFRWPLLRVMEEMQVRFRAHNREQEILVGMTRIGVPNYPERAFREGIANALIHRDYTRLGSTYVQWREDRIEISSPGGFPLGVRLDNLLVTEPRPRNPLLADAFKRAGIVERTARGIDTIFYEQLRNGHPVPSYERSTEAGVTLILPGGEANLGFVRLMVEEAQNNRPLSLDELLILTYGFVAGLGGWPHFAILNFVGALLGRFYLQKRFGPERWYAYAPIVLAGYSCGVGLIGMTSIAIALISKAVSQVVF